MTWSILLLAAALLVTPGQRARVGLRRSRQWRAPLGIRVLLVVAALAAALLTVRLTLLVAVGIAGATGYLRYRRQRRERVVRRSLAALESGLEILVGELRVGAHPVKGFETTAAEIGGPVGEMFELIASRARFGVELMPVMRSTKQITPQWIRIGHGWELAQRHGLAVADLLHANQCDLNQRARFVARVNAGLSGARATAVVLTGLPLVGIALGQLIGAHPLVVLCSGGAGGALLVIGVSLACVGLLWADHITGKALR